MTQIEAPALSACPINFSAFDSLNKITGNIDATLLLSKLGFHQKGSKLTKNGKRCITRPRKDIAGWFGFSLKKTDLLLDKLEAQNAIERQSGSWFGNRATFISVSEDINTFPINMCLFNAIQEQAGSAKATIVFSKILYAFANSTIEHKNIKWCTITKETLANWAELSIRTIDKILNSLESKGLILRENFTWRGRTQIHFHIPNFVISQFSSVIKMAINTTAPPEPPKEAPNQTHLSTETSGQNCRPQPAKTTTSIRIRTKQKKTNNNTDEMLSTGSSQSNKPCDMTFLTISNELTQRQEKYLQRAFKNTLERYQLQISKPESLLAELQFSILNPDQRKGITSFPHAVSRFLKIIADKNWRTPIGFRNHSVIGKQLHEQQTQELSEWETKKQEECRDAIENKQGLTALFSPLNRQSKTITESALRLAKRAVTLAQHGKANCDKQSLKTAASLISQLPSYINNGADRAVIADYLQKTDKL